MGYRFGGSLTDWRGHSAEGKTIDFGPGFTLGLSWTFQINSELVFQPELDLSMKKVRLNYAYHIGSGALGFEETATLYYLELPILIKLPFQWRETSSSSVYLGAVWAFSLGGRRSGHYTSTLDNITSGGFSGSIGNAETFDFGVVVGWDHHFGRSDKRYVIDLRFILGLKSVFADVDAPNEIPEDQFPYCDPITGEASEFRSGTLVLSLGFDSPR